MIETKVIKPWQKEKTEPWQKPRAFLSFTVHTLKNYEQIKLMQKNFK